MDKGFIEAEIKKNTFEMWVIGQIIALIAGGLLSYCHGFPIGFASFFAICVLVDIRRELMANYGSKR